MSRFKLSSQALLTGQIKTGAKYNSIRIDLQHSRIELMYDDIILAVLDIPSLGSKDTITIVGTDGYADFTVEQPE
jgi:hypothetical protein